MKSSMEYEAPAVVEVRGQVDHSPVAADDDGARYSRKKKTPDLKYQKLISTS